MRLTLTILGIELDVTLGPADATSPAPDDEAAALNGGTLASTGPISFTMSPATPAEWQPPERTIPWEVEEP